MKLLWLQHVRSAMLSDREKLVLHFVAMMTIGKMTGVNHRDRIISKMIEEVRQNRWRSPVILHIVSPISCSNMSFPDTISSLTSPSKSSMSPGDRERHLFCLTSSIILLMILSRWLTPVILPIVMIATKCSTSFSLSLNID
jgi:hypothetical protein